MRDRYNREITYLRLSVTDLCNLRCRYCMPAEGVCKLRHEDMLTEDEMILAVEAAASLGIRKVRVTGGEPLVKKNILSICRRIAAVQGIGEVCLTTNGILLPAFASELREAGVNRLNISLDTLNPKKYTSMTRGGKLQDALNGIEAALQAGFEKIKINTVLIGGFNDDEIRELAELTLQWPVDVRFIELMPMPGQEEFSAKAFVPDARVMELLPELQISEHGKMLHDGTVVRGMNEENRKMEITDGVARIWQLPGAQGNVGLISPVFHSFCEKCNRIRLTADGKIKPCLHSAEEYPVKGLDAERMKEQFALAISGKPACHDELSFAERSHSRRSMHAIGG